MTRMTTKSDSAGWSQIAARNRRRGRAYRLPRRAQGKGRAYRLPGDPPATALTQFHDTVPRGSTTTSDEGPEFGFSQDVADVMRTATMARRYGWGELIWLTWVPQAELELATPHV